MKEQLSCPTLVFTGPQYHGRRTQFRLPPAAGRGVIHGIFGDQGKGCFSMNERGVSKSSRVVFLTVEMGSKILAVKYHIAEKMMSNNCKKTCLVKLRGNILIWALINTCARIYRLLAHNYVTCQRGVNSKEIMYLKGVCFQGINGAYRFTCALT